MTKIVTVLAAWILMLLGAGGAFADDTEAPSVPTNFVATAVSHIGIRLTWDASTDNVAVTSYNLYKDGALLGSLPGLIAVAIVDPATTHEFRVAACDAAGNCSAQSSPASATTPAAPGGDTQAPTVPTNLVATATGATTVDLTWTASSDAYGVTRYKIYAGATEVGASLGPSGTVGGLTPSTLYAFRVSACDGAGNCSAQSLPASVTTQVADTQAPTVPANLVATALGTSMVTLQWAASTDNVGVVNYRIFQGASQVATATGTNWTLSFLSPGTMYTYRVSACDAAGNCSAQSSPASATTQAPDTQAPTIPTNLVATPAGTTAVFLNWTASTDNVGVASYRIFLGASLLITVSDPIYTVNGLTPGTLYTFTVRACDAAGNCSNPSSPASIRTLTGTTDTPTAFQDLWWSPGENGWGLTITQHNDALFIAMYVYDATGKPTWVVMSSGTWDAGHTIYSGDLYVPSGSWFGNYDKNRFVVGAPAGSASFRFTSTSAAVVTYNINGLSGSKNIERLAFGVVDNTPVTNYADAWWAGTAENGWGLVLSQQYRNIFAAWYTYETSGQTTWFVMSDGTWTTPTTYSGKLYSTHGSQVLGATYNAALFGVTEVGTLTLTFSGASAGTMTYTVNGLTQTKAISRLPF